MAAAKPRRYWRLDAHTGFRGVSPYKTGRPVHEIPAFGGGTDEVVVADVFVQAGLEELVDVGALGFEEGAVAGVHVERIERGEPEGGVAGDAVDVLAGRGFVGEAVECVFKDGGVAEDGGDDAAFDV